MNLNEELQKMRKDFILKYNLSCSSCEFWDKNRKGKCASKVYCIVRDNVFNCNYKVKKTTFRKDIRVFFCPECGKTFTVSNAEYDVAEQEYKEGVKASQELYKERGVQLNPLFTIKGHTSWIYRPDENYTEEIKKYESTRSKS